MYAKIQIFDLRGSLQGFVCGPERDAWAVFLEALDTEAGERLMRALRAEMPQRIGVIGAVSIREAYRGQQLGRTLVDSFLRQARADVVLVATTRPVRAFFRALGFELYDDSGLMVLRPCSEKASLAA